MKNTAGFCWIVLGGLVVFAACGSRTSADSDVGNRIDAAGSGDSVVATDCALDRQRVDLWDLPHEVVADIGGEVPEDVPGELTDSGGPETVEVGPELPEPDAEDLQDELTFDVELPEVVTGPEILNPSFTKHEYNPQRGYMAFGTSEAALGSVLVEDLTDGSAFRVFCGSEPALEHEVLILGLKAEHSYGLIAEARDIEGALGQAAPLAYAIGPLPVDFPPMEITVNQNDATAPGTLFFAVGRYKPLSDPQWTILLAVDGHGDVVWYQRYAPCFALERRLNGNLLCSQGYDRVYEFSMWGDTVNQWTSGALGVTTLHHQTTEISADSLLGMSNEVRTISGYGADEADRLTYNVVGDILVEFSQDGPCVIG